LGKKQYSAQRATLLAFAASIANFVRTPAPVRASKVIPRRDVRHSLDSAVCQAIPPVRSCFTLVNSYTLGGMRVVIDATPLLVRSAGVKNYLYHWIQHLRLAAGADTIGTFPPLAALRPLTHEASVVGPAPTIAGLAALAISNHTPVPILDWLSNGADVFHASVLVRHPPRRPRFR